MKKLIEFKDIKKAYGENIIHNGVNLTLFEGEILALIGANGCGKTQLMKILLSLIKMDSGEIKSHFIEDEYLDEIAIQFQEESSFLGFKVKEVIRFNDILHKDKINIKAKKEIMDILDLVTLQNKRVSKLSGGQKQRLNLYLALVRNTKILILDEFTNSLDIFVVHKIFDYIKKQQQKYNTTLVLITHQPEELRSLSERIVLLKNGTIQEEFYTKQIEEAYKGNFTKFLLETIGGEEYEKT